jgi:hypothetical protein
MDIESFDPCVQTLLFLISVVHLPPPTWFAK